jgi:glycerol-3-phosphate dehydrogenase
MIAAQCSGLFMGSGVRSPPTRSAVSMNSGITKGQVHNEGGAYVGGYWVPIEESHKINIEGGSNEGAQPAVRSATSHTSAKADGTYDVAIIGAGCIGAAVARELSKTMASVVLLEGADDVCQGATKGNSGIVHAGYDDKPGSTRARLCWKGNQMFPALDEDLHFGYQLTGSLVVARGAKEEEHLQELYQRGQTNGVKNLRIVGTEELRQMEPTLDEECTAALLSPDAGTLIPYEYTIALAENAADNGVEVRTRRMTKGITRNAEGLLEVSMDHGEPTVWVEHARPDPWQERRQADAAALGLPRLAQPVVRRRLALGGVGPVQQKASTVRL